MSAAPAGPPAARGGSIAVYVVMKVSVSWCTTAGLGVATSLLSAIQALVERSAVPATIIDVPRERFPAMIEATAYFVVSEALVNVAKHAKASTAQVSIRRLPGRLAVRVSDDGPGGARPERGSGLAGLADRVASAGGALRVDSPPGAGTRLEADIPCP